MRDEPIPDNDHITRYCKPMTIVNDDIQASAFMLRITETGLSVNWLEKLECSCREDEINQIRNIYNKELSLQLNAKIAVLNVGNTLGKIRAETPDKRNLRIVHWPELENDERDTHSEILNLHHDDEFIAELILETVQESYPARRQ